MAARASWGDRRGKWPTYCAATAAALASATSASAGIIYSGPVNLTISRTPGSFPSCGCLVHTTQQVAGLSQAFFKLGLFHGTSAGAHIGSATLHFPSLPTPPYFFRGGVLTNGFSSAQKLNSGALISFGSFNPFGGLAGNFGGATHGAWGGSNVTGFAGVFFFAKSTIVGSSPYPLYDVGWLRLRVQDLNGDQIPDSLTLIDYAYNTTPFDSIYTGQIANPEPSGASMMLLAAGAVGVLAWKRRRKQAA